MPYETFWDLVMQVLPDPEPEGLGERQAYTKARWALNDLFNALKQRKEAVNIRGLQKFRVIKVGNASLRFCYRNDRSILYGKFLGPKSLAYIQKNLRRRHHFQITIRMSKKVQRRREIDRALSHVQSMRM